MQYESKKSFITLSDIYMLLPVAGTYVKQQIFNYNNTAVLNERFKSDFILQKILQKLTLDLKHLETSLFFINSHS